jgi:hypothetical protein
LDVLFQVLVGMNHIAIWLLLSQFQMRIWVQFQHLCFKLLPMAYCDLVFKHCFPINWDSYGLTIFKLLFLWECLGFLFLHYFTYENEFGSWNIFSSHILFGALKLDHELKIRVATIFQWSKKGAIWTRFGFQVTLIQRFGTP